jgi:hypothetical protein
MKPQDVPSENIDLRYLATLIPDIEHKTHPNAEVMKSFFEKEHLSQEEREEVFEHLSSCSRCRDLYFAPKEADADIPPHKEPQYGK